MTKTTQVQRIKFILELLLLTPQSINNIQEELLNNGVQISDRQIYRDLEDLKKAFLRKGESLVVIREGNRKYWELIQNPDAERIKDFDIKTFLLSKTTSPSCLDGRAESFKNIYGLLKDNLNNSNFERYVNTGKT